MLKGKRTKGSVYQSFLICLILSAAVMVIMAILCALVAGALDDPTKHLALMLNQLMHCLYLRTTLLEIALT